MIKKGYLIREGAFLTNWDIFEELVFPTKKKAHEYMRERFGFGFPKSKNPAYGKDEDIYENLKEEYGYELVKVDIVPK